MHTVSRLRWVALLCVSISLALPAGAQAFSKAIWGPVLRNGINQFPIYKQLGVSIDEADLYWYEIALTRPADPTNANDPAYRWPQVIQQTITQATRFHMRVLLQIIGTPPWANGGQPWNWAPLHPGDYADFATAAARRYPGVHLWMVWGEANRTGTFMPEDTVKPGSKLNAQEAAAPHKYALMLNDAYGALKRVNRRNLVIGGSTFTGGDIDPYRWVQNLRLPDGRPPRMDMYAHNPFSYTAPNFSAPPSGDGQVQFSDLPRLARWIDRYLGPNIPLFLSEYTIPTAPNSSFPYWVDPSVAAKWITTALRLSRRWHRIYALGWINVYDDPPLSTGGLLDANGTPKPLFYAFARG